MSEVVPPRVERPTPRIVVDENDSDALLLRLVGRAMDARYAYLDTRPAGGDLRVLELPGRRLGDSPEGPQIEGRFAAPREQLRAILADPRSPLQRRICAHEIDDQGSTIGVLLGESRRTSAELEHFLADLIDGSGSLGHLGARAPASIPFDFPEIVQEVDEAGQLTSVSEFWARTLGYTREEVLGRRACEFLSDESAAFFRRVVEPVLQTRGEVRGLPCQLRAKGGEHLAVSLTSKVLEIDSLDGGSPMRRRVDLFVQLDQVRDSSTSALSREAATVQRVDQFVPRVLARVRADQRFSAVAYFEFDQDRRPQYVSGQGLLTEVGLCRVAGLLGEEIDARGHALFINDARVEIERPLIREFMGLGIVSGGAFPVATHGQPPSGFLMVLSDTRRRIGRGESEVLEGMCGLIDLVSQRDRAISQQRSEARIAHVTLSAIGEAVLRADAQNRIEYANPAAVRLAGVPSSELVGRSVGDALELRSSTDDQRIVDPITYAELIAHRTGEGGVPTTIRWLCASGGAADVEIHVRALRNSEGRRTGSVLTLSDVTRTRQLSRELLHRATHDALSGLYNRAEFERSLAESIERLGDEDRGHVLCFLDLDRFKIVNDTCGHAAGDELIRQIGGVLRSSVRGGDVLARLGGDEFGVLFLNCDLENGQRIASDLVERVAQFRFHWSGQEFRIGASLGCVPVAQGQSDAEALMRLSDRACYIAKENGRNRVEVLKPTEIEHDGQMGGSQWAERIESALEDGSFSLLGQPIVPIGAGEQAGRGVEVLLRKLDSSGRQVPPGAFLPAAERFELSVRLDRWVIERTFEELSSRPGVWERIEFCSINLSGQSLADPAFPRFVKRALTESGLDPARIGFEFTETDAVANPGTAGRFVSELSALGCRFLLDDFGSGLSAFGYLRDMEIELIKIDGRFVRNMAQQNTDQEVVRAIHQIARATGKRTIAEHVEDQETLALLEEIGVDYAQGYAIGRPADFAELLDGAV